MLYISDIEIIKAYMKTTGHKVNFTDDELLAILEYYRFNNEEFNEHTLQAWGSYENPIDCLEVNDRELLPDDFYGMDCVIQMDMAWKIIHRKYPVIVMEEDDDLPYHILVHIKK